MMDAPQSSEMLIPDADALLQESVVDSEMMEGIHLYDGKASADLPQSAKKDLMEIPVFIGDINVSAGEEVEENVYPAGEEVEENVCPAGEEVEENAYPTGEEVQENVYPAEDAPVEDVAIKPLGSGESESKIEKSKSPKKTVRLTPLKILPRPDSQNSGIVANGHPAIDAKLDTAQTTPEKMSMRTADGTKTKGSAVMSMSGLKRSSLSIQDKLQIIQDLENGERQHTVCKRRRLPKSTVQGIWQCRHKIAGSVLKTERGDRKRVRRPKFEDVEQKLLEWMESLRTQNVTINGPQLRAKAQVYAKCLGLTEFRCSTGWLDKFKNRHNLYFKKFLKPVKNGVVGDRKTALDWVIKIWPSYCDGYSPENIFNADEVGLFYKATPEESVTLKCETCHGGKMAKDRLTVLLCTNSIGTEKLKPLVIGCQSNPKSFTWISKLENLPVEYIYDPKSWMTQEIFIYWLTMWDKKLKLSGRKILLIVDSSPAHVTDDVQLTNIRLVTLAPIIASLLQPLEHGVTKYFKVRYRHLLLDRLVRRCEEMEFTNPGLSLLESLSLVHAAWLEISPQLIANCFKNTNIQSLSLSTHTPIPFSSSSENDEDMKDDTLLIEQALRCGMHLPEDFSLHSYAMTDSKLHVTDYGIIETGLEARKTKVKESKEDEDSDDDSIQNIIVPSRRDVQMFIDAIRNWAMISNENCDYSVHNALATLESFASQQSNSLANLPIPIANSTSMSNGGSNTTNLANLNLNFVNGVPISMQNNGISSNSSSNTVKDISNSPQTVFYTPNFGSSQVVQGQTQPNVFTLSIDPIAPRNSTDSNEEESSNANTTKNHEQSESEHHCSNSASHNIANQQPQQYFAYLG